MPPVNTNPIMSKKTFYWISLAQFVFTIFFFFGMFYYHFNIAFVPTASMTPTLKVGAVFIYKIGPASEFDYDDIVVFYPYPKEDVSVSNGFEVLYNQRIKKEIMYVKRLIGLPGDVLEIRDGFVWRNGERLDPDYLSEETLGTMEAYTVPEGYFFCMGDNRNNSLDSRYLGPFPESSFVGKVILSFNRPWVK